MVSRWDDPEYPDMVPVMGTAEAMRGPFWRWYPGLYAGPKLMHNSHWPANITDHGRIGQLDGIRLTHNGWSTLEERISRVGHYMRLDPDFRHNFGVAYDRSLLFGYALDEVDLLKADYHRRVRGEFDRTEPRPRLPIEAEPRAIGRGYGPRADGFHPGVDFAADPGSPIYAAISGTVRYAGELDHLYSVIISNGDTETRYVFRPGDAGHIAVGDRICAGTQIGSLGAEDESTDAYLHFETRVRRAHVNPLRYLGNMGLRPGHRRGGCAPSRAVIRPPHHARSPQTINRRRPTQGAPLVGLDPFQQTAARADRRADFLQQFGGVLQVHVVQSFVTVDPETHRLDANSARQRQSAQRVEVLIGHEWLTGHQ